MSLSSSSIWSVFTPRKSSLTGLHDDKITSWKDMLNWTASSSSGRQTWKEVVQHIGDSLPMLSALEVQQLYRLANGFNWMDFTDSSRREKYGTIFDEYRMHMAARNAEASDVAHKIQKDISRTFGLFCRSSQLASLAFSLNRGTYLKSLQAVLLASSKMFGYCQGMNFIAANLLLCYSERDSFVLFCFLMKERNLNILFNPKSPCLVEYIKVFEKRLKLHYRRIYDHLKDINFTGFCYAIEWFTTCFLVSNPGELSLCVTDMLMADMKDTLIRIGLSILANLESQLLTFDLEQMQMNFKTLVLSLHPVDVVSVALFIESKGDADFLAKMAHDLETAVQSPWSRKAMESNWSPDQPAVPQAPSDMDAIAGDVHSATALARSLVVEQRAYDADVELEEEGFRLRLPRTDPQRPRSASLRHQGRKKRSNRPRRTLAGKLATNRDCCRHGELVTVRGEQPLREKCMHRRARRGRCALAQGSAASHMLGIRVLLRGAHRVDGYSKRASCSVYCTALDSHVSPAGTGLVCPWIPQVFSDWFSLGERPDQGRSFVFKASSLWVIDMDFQRAESEGDGSFQDAEHSGGRLERYEEYYSETSEQAVGALALAPTHRLQTVLDMLARREPRKGAGATASAKQKVMFPSPDRGLSNSHCGLLRNRPIKFLLLETAAIVNKTTMRATTRKKKDLSIVENIVV